MSPPEPSAHPALEASSRAPRSNAMSALGIKSPSNTPASTSASASTASRSASGAQIKRQPSALAFWQNQAAAASGASSPARSSPTGAPMSRAASASSTMSAFHAPAPLRSSSSPHRASAETRYPPTSSASASFDRPRDTSPNHVDASSHDRARRRRNKLLHQMKRQHSRKVAGKTTSPIPASSTASPSHFDISDTWSSNSDNGNDDAYPQKDDDDDGDDDDDVAAPEPARDLGIGTSSSQRRRKGHHRASRSLQNSPGPTQIRRSQLMTASLSYDAGAQARRPSADSGESQSFYDATDDDAEMNPERSFARMSDLSTSEEEDDPDDDDDDDDGGGGGRRGSRTRSAGFSSRRSREHSSSSWLRIGSKASQKPSTSTLRQADFARHTEQDATAPGALGSLTTSESSAARESSATTSPTMLSTPSSGSMWSPTSDQAPSFLPSPPAPSASATFSRAFPPPRPLPDGPLPPTPHCKEDLMGSESPSSSGIGGSSFASEDASSSAPSVSAAPLDDHEVQEEDGGAVVEHHAPALTTTAASPEKTAASISSETSSTSNTSNTSALGPHGTIRGRPRGATVGAVPATGRTAAFLNRFSNQKAPRPRSLLSHELILPMPEISADAPASPDPASAGRALVPSTSSPADLPSNAAATASSTEDSSRRTSIETGTNEPETSVTSLSLVDENASSSSVSGANPSSAAPQNLAPPASTSTAQPAVNNRGRSGSTASLLLQQVQYPPKSHASFVIAVVGHRGAGKSTVIKKGLRQFGLSKPQVLSEKVTSHSTICIVNQEQRTIEVLEIDTSVLLNGPGKSFAWPKFLPHIDAVILCYDASQISSFRGMATLLEQFALGKLSTVMLACKSEMIPKAVDPYYASDMAGVYNVGLAECTVQSEEGKKRMRDCFSYLVKEVAKSRAGQQRKRLAAADGSGSGAPEPHSSSRPLSTSANSGTPARPDASVASAGSGSSVRRPSASSVGSRATDFHRDRAGSGASGQSSVRGDSTAASSRARGSSSASHASSDNQAKHIHHTHQHRHQSRDASSRDGSSVKGEQSEEDAAAVQQSINRAQLGLQSAKSAGGYVTIEELWDKFFFAAVSGNDDRFLLMFMVFYRGFVRPIELLRELVTRFKTLALGEHTDGVMIRFSLMRLTAMLGDWMQDYPGDLSGPETYPLLCEFFDYLCTHPSTTHIASPLRPHLEEIKDAVDLDAAWSKDQDSSKPKSIAADVPPVRPPLAPELSHDNTLELPGGLRDRSHSDASSIGMQSEQSGRSEGPQGGAAPHQELETRHRSGSDVTNSSVGGVGSGAASSTSVTESAGSANVDTWSPARRQVDAHQQKVSLRTVSQTLENVDDAVIATELSRLEWELFTAIRPRDLLRHILVARNARGREGPVAKSIAHFNYISFWVCSMILVQSKTKHRARMLEKFMNIAAILRHDNNYNTLQAVLAGLGNASIHRLKHTRELLTGKPVNKTYQSLARLMGSDRSFAAYRLALENSEGRTIPYLGVHLQDILSMSDGNPSKRATDDMVHWRKFSLMDEAVMAIVRCQSWNQVARPNPAIEQLVMNLPVMDEEALYQRSLQVEPRPSQGNSALASSKILKILNPA